MLLCDDSMNKPKLKYNVLLLMEYFSRLFGTQILHI